MVDMPKELINAGFSPHDCEAWYRCPYCNEKFGEYLLPPQRDKETIYCPRCKEEVRRSRY